MLELVEVTRPRVCRTGGQLTAATTMRMEWDCLKGVVQVYSPVSPSSACRLFRRLKIPGSVLMHEIN